MKKITILTLVLFLAFLNANCKIIYVNSNGDNSNGTTWLTAYNDLQTAIDSAESSDQIWVAQGIYYPSALLSGTEKAFQLTNKVEIYGGFGGFELELSQRNISTYSTILSADIGTIGDNTDNYQYVFFNVMSQKNIGTSILDGFEISGAKQNAISNYHVNLNLANIIFKNNTGTNGSAVYNNTDTLTIENCKFYDNYSYAIDNDTTKISLKNCEFKRIELDEKNNIMAIKSIASSINIDSCRFEHLNNIGNDGSIMSSFSILNINKSTFYSNKLLKNPNIVALYHASVINNNNSICNVDGCKFDSNYSAYSAAVIYDIISNSTYKNCSFTKNISDSIGGVICILNNSTVNLINSEFLKNTAYLKGGVVYSYSSTSSYLSHLNIINCTLAANYAGQGGALYLESKYGTSKYNIKNSIIWDNESSIQPAEIYVVSSADTLFMDNTCFNNSKSNFLGKYVKSSCINTEPLFALRGIYPYSITKESPCIDSGNNDYISESFDIRGNNFPRKLNKNGTIGSNVDMGAYEYKDGIDELTSKLILYVNLNAIGNNNGKSWANAFINLQDAIDYSINGDQIWVAKGTYKPTIQIGGTSQKNKAFRMKAGVKIYGGFTGTETLVSQASPEINLCQLSGKLNDSVYCFHVFNHSEVLSLNENAELNGFIITQGYCKDEYNNDLGAGIYNVNNSPTIINCCFFSNVADEGGAIANYNSSPKIINCTFTNLARSGGNISNYNGSSPILTNCSFGGDTGAENYGGAIYNVNSTLVLDSCVFNNVIAKIGAAIYNIENSLLTIRNSSFVNCSADENGGAIYNNSSQSNIYNTFIVNCQANNGSAIYNFGKDVYLYNSLISNCKCQNGTIYNENFGNVNFVNVTIAKNTAENICGGIYNYNGNASIKNSIIWDNVALQGSSGSQIFNQIGNFELIHSCFPTGDENSKGTLNTFYCVNEEPQFATNSKWNFNLCSSSPCIDEGINEYINEEFDIRGNGFPRKLNKSGNNSAVIDMGAYEYKFGTDSINSMVKYEDYFSASVYPNPISDNAELRFSLTQDMIIDIYICDLSGNKIVNVINSTLISQGYHKIKIDLNKILSGTYFAVINSNNIGSKIKLVIVK